MNQYIWKVTPLKDHEVSLDLRMFTWDQFIADTKKIEKFFQPANRLETVGRIKMPKTGENATSADLTGKTQCPAGNGRTGNPKNVEKTQCFWKPFMDRIQKCSKTGEKHYFGRFDWKNTVSGWKR